MRSPILDVSTWADLGLPGMGVLWWRVLVVSRLWGTERGVAATEV